MTIGYFSRAFNKDHKSLSTKTHIIDNDKILCGYKPHKTMQFQWCIIGVGVDRLDVVECDKCKEKYLKKGKVNYEKGR